MTTINPNDTVRIKLTAFGKRLIVQRTDALNDSIRSRGPAVTYRATVPKWDSDGWLSGQFWDLMGNFDGAWSAGQELPFSELEISE